jgi:hypothetical protein
MHEKNANSLLKIIKYSKLQQCQKTGQTNLNTIIAEERRKKDLIYQEEIVSKMQ